MSAEDFLNEDIKTIHTTRIERIFYGADKPTHFAKKYVIEMMERYARLMCKEQIEICAERTCEILEMYPIGGVVDQSVMESPFPEALRK